MKTIVEKLENGENIKTKIKERKRGKREGFSFIELLIMLVILSIVSGMSYMAYMRMDPKMDIAVERQDMGELAKAIALLSAEGKIKIRGDVAIPGNTTLDNYLPSTSVSGKINDGMITTGQTELEKAWGRSLNALDDTWHYVRLNRTETINGKTYNESRLLIFRADADGTNFDVGHPMRSAYIHERISVPDSAWE